MSFPFSLKVFYNLWSLLYTLIYMLFIPDIYIYCVKVKNVANIYLRKIHFVFNIHMNFLKLFQVLKVSKHLLTMYRIHTKNYI